MIYIIYMIYHLYQTQHPYILKFVRMFLLPMPLFIFITFLASRIVKLLLIFRSISN